MAVDARTTAPRITPELAQRQQSRRRGLQALGLVFPGIFWLTLFFVLPFVFIVIYSFLTRGETGNIVWTFTLGNYARLFTDSVFWQVFGRSIWYGLLTTLGCLILAYPMALFIVQCSPRWRTLLIFLILIPFWTNFLVRTYAWMVILNNNGLINTILAGIGLPTLTLMNTQGAVMIGLLYGELPFMVLPIYASLDRFDFTLLEAAQDLGANRWRSFLRVMLPLTMPGIAAGSVLVFIPTVGQFVVSDLLGGAKVALLGNLLQQQFKAAQNWPLGSAIAVVCMAVLTVAVIFYFRSTSEEDR
jgi:spermidine/putrescine transport system permease protein